METKFDTATSPLKEAYALLNATDPGHLSDRYTDEDQKLVLAHAWDYKNPELIVNKLKELLDSINSDELSDNERYWRANILWFWNHHAIDCALRVYSDREAALGFARRALEIQPAGHPNKITKLYYLLLSGDVAGAREWQKQIDSEPEKEYAEVLFFELGKPS